MVRLFTAKTDPEQPIVVGGTKPTNYNLDRDRPLSCNGANTLMHTCAKTGIIGNERACIFRHFAAKQVLQAVHGDTIDTNTERSSHFIMGQPFSKTPTLPAGETQRSPKLFIYLLQLG